MRDDHTTRPDPAAGSTTELAQDVALAREAADGDETAWRAIYDRTQARLFNFLCYQTGDRDAARDLLQETYVVGFTRLPDWRGEGTLLGWLRTIALRKCLDWRRQVKLRVRKLAELARDVAGPGGFGPAEPPTGLGAGIQAALDRLSSRQRAALLLRELEDQPFAAIADTLGCSEATARVHHHRACRNLRRWLEEGDDLVFGGNAGGLS
jgi:RNA polymerase sigma factor (sigma-70 family)